ncbi:MAG: biopolymer transporter ExbD [Candidatus Omnitrophica bacterium]|nr:biopolymer transporter ExbD [Candidatus Omnitrophota bacterium]
MRFLKQDKKQFGFQMAPMIDVVFQLLIFFMSVSTFHQLETEKDIKIPVADEAKSLQEAAQNLIVNIRKDGTIIINQIIYRPEQIVAILADLPLKHVHQAIIIRADKNVSHGRVSEVMSACAAAGVWDVSFAAYQEEQK